MGVTGRVVGGKVVLDTPLPDGIEVEVNLRETDDAFEVDEELEAELDESEAEIERGEGIPAEEVLAEE